jgi:hypothetical protein
VAHTAQLSLFHELPEIINPMEAALRQSALSSPADGGAARWYSWRCDMDGCWNKELAKVLSISAAR